MPRADRREALLDAAAGLVADGDPESVSMELVAERAGVSRPLLYKHFANRRDLLEALYERESSRLQAELIAAVKAAASLEDKLRALVQGALRAQGTRGATFAALQRAGARTRARREERRARDERTVRYFANEAARDLGLDRREARTAVAILLGAIQSVLSQWRQRPTAEYGRELEDTYVTLALGGLAALAKTAPRS